MNWRNGLNFGQAKYEVIDRDTFIPYIRSDFRAVIPFEILIDFTEQRRNDLVALLKITDRVSKKSNIRVKKLCRSGESLSFSLEKERNLKDIIVKVLSIKTVQDCVNRMSSNSRENIPTLSILPSHTSNYSFPYQNSKRVTPIFAFELEDAVYCISHFGWKNIIFKKEIMPDELTALAIGLYFAEGGKVTASFTNSSPKIINVMLDFIEQYSNIERDKINARIYCHTRLQNKKKNLEEFWYSQVGISNYGSKLHLSENSRSPCGTLELNFCSQILKNLLCGLIKKAFDDPLTFDPKNIIRGIFSGDGCPIQQTKYFICHHITLDKNYWKSQFDFIDKLISRHGIQLKTVPSNPNKIKDQIRAVIYSNWYTNMYFMFLDPYRFELINREKFARRFLSLEKTRLFLSLEDGCLIKGIDLVNGLRPLISLRNHDFINLVQKSPKPNRKYEVQFSENGLQVRKILQDFLNNVYPKYRKELENFKVLLGKFDLLEKNNRGC
ncbi:MAG: hypothetical protein QMD36_02175 [Candidatus Aenigmarchaeota archaeon]|nr:hypothetical protein [Candidatus Aenigmarchaeota archaeon]